MDPLLHNFIIDHQDDDTDRLLLARRDRWTGIDVPLAVNCIISRRKLKDKLPSWYAHTDLMLPLPLSAEQCSSVRTAAYKTAFAAEIYASTGAPGRPRIADLTGGLGVDSAAFSEVAESVLYNEMQPVLSDAARHNFPILGLTGITVRNNCLTPSDGSLNTILDGFAPDIIFLDPARRSAGGQKVFRLADCSPDILQIKDELLAACPDVLLKLSPMADISQICRELGGCVREVRVVETGGECKELLVWLERNWSGPYSVAVVTDPVIDGTVQPFRFLPMDESLASARFVSDGHDADFLFEPGKALLKSGSFNLISSRFNLLKLAPSTHLYLCSDPSIVSAWGKVFRIVECLPMSKTSIKNLGSRFHGASVTARNAHMTSEELAARLVSKHDADVVPAEVYHIFAAGIAKSAVVLYVCKRL